jgi:hypothetical protein
MRSFFDDAAVSCSLGRKEGGIPEWRTFEAMFELDEMPVFDAD